MHIKPYVVLGLATICSGAALTTVVVTSDPYGADPAMVGLFWTSFVLTIFSLMATLACLLGRRLTVALVTGLVWAWVGVGVVWAAQHQILSGRLLMGSIGATIVITLALWMIWRPSKNEPSQP